MIDRVLVICGFLAGAILLMGPVTPAEPILEFDDAPLQEPLSHPDWFKLSFLDFREDLEEALAAGKKGLIVYFGQKYCAYCKAQLQVNFGKPDIVRYTRAHFDVIEIDIHGDRTVTDMSGRQLSERDFASVQKANFTPTLIFYDERRREALRLPGYYPPYKFRAALEYVADGHYLRESFRTYLARADVAMVFEEGSLNYEDFFLPGPFMLDRSRRPGERPLVVFFEQADCHACDVLHTGPFRNAEILQRMRRLEVVQLGLWSSAPVVTPAGERLTARQWADNLGLFYAPTLIFFDPNGAEIIRVASVVQFYRLRNVLDYVLTGAYKEEPDFQRWRNTRPGLSAIDAKLSLYQY